MKHFTHIVLGFSVIAMLSAPGSVAAASVGLPPPPPSVTANAVDISATRGVATTITFSGTTSGAGPLSFATSSSPTHGTLDTISGATVHYTSDASFTGTDSFTYQAFDGADSSTDATVTITVPGATLLVRTGSTAVWSRTVPLN